jgi:hypothetical protein
MFFKKKPREVRGARNGAIRCSFCGKAEAEVAKLIAGQAGFICDECVRVCTGLIAEDRVVAQQAIAEQAPRPKEPTSPPGAGPTAYCAFCGRPLPWDEAVLVPEQGAYCPACIADESKPPA